MRVLPTLLMATTLALSPAAFAKDGGGGGGAGVSVGGGAGVSVGGGNGHGGGANASAGGQGNAGGNGNAGGKATAETGVTGRGNVDPTGKSMGANARGSSETRSSGGLGIGRGQVDPTGRAMGSLTGRADLGKLNAAHASLTGRTNAAPNSTVGQIRSYEEAKISALALPQSTAAERAVRADAIARANAMLETVANKPVTPGVVAQVDSILGINSAM